MPRYIDAEEVKWNVLGVLHCEYATTEGDMALSAIEDTPTADVAPVIHSHWIHTGEYLTNSDGKRLKKLSDLYVCHRCHRVEALPEPYCNCGAKMDEKMDEENEQ